MKSSFRGFEFINGKIRTVEAFRPFVFEDGQVRLLDEPVAPVPYRKQPIPADLRWAVWERDNFTCRSCGRRTRLSVDHVVPESAGGPTTIDNLQTLCTPCNRRKGTKGPDEWQP